MVKAKIRRRRLHRRRLKNQYLPRGRASQEGISSLLMFPLLVLMLCLLVVKQPNPARSLQFSNLSTASFAASVTSLLSALGQAFLAQTPAQIPPANPVSQQGAQIIFNGRSLPIAWSQRQDQSIGITDVGMRQAIGVELLSTNDIEQQPIEWFSDQRTNPLMLGTWRTGPYRYLDVTTLAQNFGWQVNPEGSSLRITTPSANVTSVRQGRQSWGDRIVLDLDQATPWQVDEQPGEAIVTVDAQISSNIVQAFKSSPGNRLTSVKVESRGNQTVIRVGIPSSLRPRVWAIPNPNRLLIDIRPDSFVERDILWGPGIRWRQQLVRLGSASFPVVSVEITPQQAELELKPITSNTSTVVGTAPLITTAQRLQAIAAINGGFFNRNNQLPLGAVRVDGRWVSGPILGRGAIAWNDAGETTIGRLKLQETLVTASGQQFPIEQLNSGYVGAGIYRHTPDWGTTYTAILNNEAVITVEQNQVVNQQRANASDQTTIPIPPNGYLLVVRDRNDILDDLAVGTPLEINSATSPPEFDRFPQVIGGGPLLLQNQQIVLNTQSEQFSDAFRQQGASRSVIATDSAGTLMLVAIHNRMNGSGPTLSETAQLMQQMGAVNALNLDGGSSTTLYLGGQLLDRASSTAARVNTGVAVFSKSN